MPNLSPQQMAQKWAAKYGASQEAYKAGVTATQVNPAQQAIAAKDRWIAALNDAANRGAYEAGLSGVTLQSWQQACVEKGAQAIPTAARLAVLKVQKVEQEMKPKREAIKSALPPRGTLEQNLERARLMAMGMAQLKRGG